MKVLHCAETVKGGVASVLNQLLQDQLKHSFSVHCLAPSDQISEVLEEPGLNIYTFCRSGRNAMSYLRFMLALINALYKVRPNIVHIHSTFAGILVRVPLILAYPFFRPRVIYCPHGWSFMMAADHCSLFKRRFYASVEKILLRFTDEIVCVSDYEKRCATEYGLAGEKISVIHNGVQLPLFSRTSYSAPPSSVIKLLYVGRFDTSKGFDLLLDAMHVLRDEPFELCVVGGAVHSVYTPKQLPNVKYCGWIPHRELHSYFTESDLLVVPSRWEAFGLVAAEAHSYGLAVLASDSCSLPEIVQHQKNGWLFTSGVLSDLVSKLRNVDRAILPALGAQGKADFIEKFTSEAMCKRTRLLYLCGNELSAANASSPKEAAL